MQLEEQRQPITQPEISPQVDSTPIKTQHGSKRPGAGEVLSEIDVMAIYRDIFKNGSRTLKAQCVKDFYGTVTSASRSRM
jgi:hypothetical protein